MAGPRKKSEPRAGRHESRTQAKAADHAWLYGSRPADAESESAPAEVATAASLLGPEIMLCDAGELEDVNELLTRLGDAPLRVHPSDLALLEPWELPARLFVTTVRLGFGSPPPPGLARPGVCWVAVGDGDTATVTTAMLRRGFHFVIRRPVHPESLRLLFAQILYRGKDHRRAERFSYGAEVRWRSGLRGGRCHMAEISSEGCRLLLREPVPLGRRISLRVPIERGSERTVKLRGRLVRRDQARRDLGGVPASVAVAFEDLSKRARAQLDLVLAACAAGPASARGDSSRAGSGAAVATPQPAHTPLPVRLAARAQKSAGKGRGKESPPPADESAAASPGYDRRLAPRVSLAREVVAIDPADRNRVTHTLVGRDLSLGGMSIEPHPLLSPGEKLHVALYGADLGEPLVVHARVVRTDGPRGFGLRFERMAADALKRLSALVAALPSVESLAEDKTRAQGVVLGEIVLAKVRRKA